MTNVELRKAREAAGLTQRELADKAGVSRTLVAFAERGLALGDGSAAKIERALKSALRRASKTTVATLEQLSA